jgi:TDG/mug DNA glycosylase family protein
VRRPTKEELAGSYGTVIPDLVAPDLRVLLVGINPSLWSGWSGFHFGRPSNRLWITLHEAGFTDRKLHPEDTDALLQAGIGITNLVNRATARADELTDDEIRAGLPRLTATVRRWRPRSVAVLGITAYRTAFGRPKAIIGPQPEDLAGSALWVLPNPSGLNAHYQQPALTDEYARLADAVGVRTGQALTSSTRSAIESRMRLGR